MKQRSRLALNFFQSYPRYSFSLEPTEDCTTSVWSSLYSTPTPSSDNDSFDNEEDGDSHCLLHTGGISDLVTTVSLIMLPGSPSFFQLIICACKLYQRRESVDQPIGGHLTIAY